MTTDANGSGASSGHIVGVDIGGTFTDAIVLSRAGRVVIGKASSTPPDFEQGFIDSIAASSTSGPPLDRPVKEIRILKAKLVRRS